MGCAIKIVPDATPDADGKWINIDAELPTTSRWVEAEQRLSPHIPEGWHLVALGDRTRNIADDDIWNVPAGAL